MSSIYTVYEERAALLDACITAEQILNAELKSLGYAEKDMFPWYEELSKIRAAIAKAEGRND